jgi:hypothetical protein
MLSRLELRHIIENAFLPKACSCSITPRGSMTIQLFNPNTREEELVVTGIDPATLVSSRAIAALVGEIKEEARMKPSAPERISQHA